MGERNLSFGSNEKWLIIGSGYRGGKRVAFVDPCAQEILLGRYKASQIVVVPQ